MLKVLQQQFLKGESGCAGCSFAHFDGYNTLRVGGGGTGTFVNCTFIGNQITTTFTDNSVIEADAGKGSDTLISLEQCTFSDNLPSPPRLIAADHSGRDWKGLIYSDQGEEVTVISDSSQKWQGPAAPLSEVPINKGLMLTAEDDELLAIQEVCAPFAPFFCATHKFDVVCAAATIHCQLASLFHTSIVHRSAW